MTCSKCSKPATFEIPESLCTRHWAEWFTAEYDETPEIRETLIQEIIEGFSSEDAKE